ncbi:MAG: pyridoxal-phosphate dependent enzyme [Planctomycetota bacterium]|nr:pyridoxal-phosphate dependent enzyme [Planctomycetota bacterium]MDA1105298.1 pyridoxal-phosphate dependent enzyme [Planctomycetota bacterium]
MSAPVYASLLDMIGSTPMMRLSRLDAGPCELWVKLENQNPGQSIKDRIALSMINAAERDGQLKPGGRIFEGTAGNTGIALALVAAVRGYQLTVVMPDKMSEEKVSHLRAMGATVVQTRSDVAKGHPEYYQDLCERLAREAGGFYVNQFGNPANVEAHYTTTGPEIWEQMGGRVDAFVAGVGSGGTVAGIGKYLKEKNPQCEVILADPVGSILTPLVNEGKRVDPGSWLVEGIGEDFVPDILDLSIVDSAIAVSDDDAFRTVRDLLRTEAILAGSSVGVLLCAALQYCRKQTSPKRVVTIICDSGAKYLSKMYSDWWLHDQGMLERAHVGDLRDLIVRRHQHREDFCLLPHVPLAQAIKRMQTSSVSQMAVVDASDRLVGVIDEFDILLALSKDPAAAQRPVSDTMVHTVETVAPKASIESILPILRSDRVVLVADGPTYYGLITKMDLIQHLRRHGAANSKP